MQCEHSFCINALVDDLQELFPLVSEDREGIELFFLTVAGLLNLPVVMNDQQQQETTTILKFIESLDTKVPNDTIGGNNQAKNSVLPSEREVAIQLYKDLLASLRLELLLATQTHYTLQSQNRMYSEDNALPISA